MMNTEIKRMDSSHIKALSEIEKECFSTPWSENALGDELNNGFSRFFVAECNGAVAGYIGAHSILGEVYITNVAVSEAFRRKGIAEKLIKTLVEFCENEGMEFVTLEVRRSNKAAKKLYAKMGFREVGERKDFYENPREDAILMTYKR
ncbi:MAG: ribosomal protein S18-alanine N-acetyltransferase [Clostridia bacterium]|nr:ribosomal protein S18-alanine N-acetyltransferase [Clostridia bacterium]